MALTVIIRKKVPEVAIVQWFLDDRDCLNWANGPLIQMDLGEFRISGFELVKQHFANYATARLTRQSLVSVFQPGEAKKIMKGGRALYIDKEPSGEIVFSPAVIGKYSLAHLKRSDKKLELTIAADVCGGDFWIAFDSALAKAEPDEVVF